MSKQMIVEQSIISVIVIAIAVFITMQVVHGQNITNQSSGVDKVIEDAKRREEQIKQNVINAWRETKEFILNYCSLHADRPNPIQDLIDMGFLFKQAFEEETCKSIQVYEIK